MEPYRVKNQYHSQGRTIRVIHVGAGAAGLLTAYKMQKLFSDYELVCYEKSVPANKTASHVLIATQKFWNCRDMA